MRIARVFQSPLLPLCNEHFLWKCGGAGRRMRRAVATIGRRSAPPLLDPQTGSIAGVASGSQASAGSRFSWRITSTEQVAWRTIAVAFEPMR